MQIIDQLVVLLGMDPAGFKKGQKEAQEALTKTREVTDRHTKEMEERAKSTAAAFGKVKNEILGMLGIALSVNGLKSFSERVTNSDAAVGRLARNIGIATSSLSAWEGMARKFGGTSSDMDSAFRTAFKIAQDIKLGGSTAQGPLGYLFGKAGIGDGLEQLNRLARSGNIEGMMRLLQKAVALSPDKSLAMSLMGQAGFSEQTFNVMREVNDQLEQQLELQRALNSVNERDVQIATERQRAWSRLGDAIESAGRKMMNSGNLANTTGVISNTASDFERMAKDPSQILPILMHRMWQGLTMSPAELMGRPVPGQFQAVHRVSGKVVDSGQSKEQYLASLEQKWGLPPGVLDAMWLQESSRGKNLRSPKGAKGPFQFMGATAVQYGIAGQEDDFYKSANAAAMYLRDLLGQYGGSLRKALMAYNGGGRGAAGMYAESTNYASSIMGRMQSKTDVHIGHVSIYTQATDAQGIARDFSSGVQESYSFAAMSGVGLQ